MTYVVAGVTGQTGSVVADTLLSRGQRVRVLVRDEAKGEPFRRRGAEIAIGDLRDADSLAQALTGAQGAYLLVPPAQVPDFRAYQRQLGDALIRAVERSSIPHVVFLSSIGAQHESETGPIAQVAITEHRLSKLSSTRFSHIRAGYFMENLSSSFSALTQGVLPSFLPATLPIPMVATRDIGALAAAELLSPPPQTTVTEFSGPLVTTLAVAEAAQRILGRPITVQEAPLSAVVPTLVGFGISPDMAALYQEMFSGFIAGRITFEGPHRRLEAPTSIEDFLRGALRT